MQTELLIANAIYFQGLFKIPFDARQTEQNVPFFTEGAHSWQVGTVTKMHSRQTHCVAQKVGGLWDVVRLEYALSLLTLVLIKKHGKDDEAVLKATEVMYDLDDF